ncbi:dCTP deaminase domain-containing protein [Roseibium marinum]|uniref:Deoxycytidine triphosphate deaminase n=1 Tax=Roseibium marinum TaxID=281252 RepID=A0A2S3V2K5_9HYPH|nr:hypothetical protein [Roseibium marinum]POF34135.1 deoxycytidine triphosphate deaminase [Roseibium marinum]
MLLTDTEIKAAGVITYQNSESFGSTSYNLLPDAIIDSEGEVYKGDGYTIKPQEIVWVTSKEIVSLPHDITAHATIKTSLCNKGLLALNIGIIDPGWNGPLATAIINFSKSNYYLSPTKSFLRLSFYRHSNSEIFKPITKKRYEYQEDKRKDAIEIFGSTFLDVKSIAKDVKKELFGSFAPRAAFYVTMLGFGLAGFALFASLAAYFLPGNGAAYQANFTSLQQRIDRLDEQTRELSTGTKTSIQTQVYEIKGIEDRLNEIEAQLAGLGK